jgi:hypothetical protein
VAYDAGTGAKLWVRHYNGPASDDDFARALATSPDGTAVYVTGRSDGGSTRDDFATVAYDARTGARLWTRRFNGRPDRNDAGASIGVTPDGATVFVTGSSVGGASRVDYATIAYDALTGSTLWVRRYNGPGNGYDFPASLGVGPNGDAVYVTGSSWGGPTLGTDYATIAYDALTGARLWTKRLAGPGNSHAEPRSLGVNPDGTAVYVTGTTFGPRNGNYVTVAYDAATGASRWLRRYTNRDDNARSLTVSRDGSAVYVTGYSGGGPTRSYDFATVAYHAVTGDSRWVSRYNGPTSGFDVASSVVASPDGTAVYVTGSSDGDSTGLDYVTIAYRP